MSGAEFRITKVRVPVEIICADGEVLVGFLFTRPQGRLTDTLNDSRRYLPFETVLGEFTALSKDVVVKATPLKQEREIYSGNDPYRILGLHENATFEEVRVKRLQLCGNHNPDKIRGLGLPEEYVELATIHIARVNEAYQRITKDRPHTSPKRLTAEPASASG